MYYGEIKKCDIANGNGVRVTLFVSGCTNKCKNCFQPETWDFLYGRPFDEEARKVIFGELEKSYIDGLTLLGGDPFEPKNQPEVLRLVKDVKAKYPDKTIWAFSGFRLEDELMCEGAYPHTEITKDILDCIDVLVDGRYIDELYDISLRFRGSSNQRIIDMNLTRKEGKLILWDNF